MFIYRTILFLSIPFIAFADNGQTLAATPSPVMRMLVVAGIGLIPFAIILFTSFLKTVIVLSLFRQAIGLQQSPPNQVLNAIALFMSIYVMYPTISMAWNESMKVMDQTAAGAFFSNETYHEIVMIGHKAKEPIQKFLVQNSFPAHSKLFLELAQKKFPEQYAKTLKANDFIVLIPSYITSQLKGAFEIGVLIYLPFFVIDLVTSNILLAMGMMMLSPLTIALPLKLLLVVMVDGWTILIKGIVLSYR